ncbi:MAG: hypothetical protein RSA12_08520 [Clostridia bacterium]
MAEDRLPTTGGKNALLATLIPALIAFAVGVLLIAYQATFFIIVACAVFVFGGFLVVKYIRAKDAARNIVVLTVGVFLLLAGVLMALSPDVASKVLLFIELGLGVWAAVSSTVHLLALKKHKEATDKRLFLAQLIVVIICLCQGLLLVVLSFTGMDKIVLPDRIIMGIMLIAYSVGEVLLMVQKSPKASSAAGE